MVDEVLPWTGPNREADWSNLKPSSQVDLIMAMSPALEYHYPAGPPFQVKPPASQRTIYTQQLLEPYRNSAELDRLLSCLKCHHKDLACKSFKVIMVGNTPL